MNPARLATPWAGLLCLMAAALLAACNGGPTPTATPTNTLIAPVPASTLAPADTPTADAPANTPAPTPPPAATVQSKATSEPTATPTPAPEPTATPTPTPTPHPNPNLRYHEEKQFALMLINGERAEAGKPPLVLGNNISTQIHAENSLEGCYSSLWSADGLKPDARYTLSGGYQFNNLTVIGKDYCGLWVEKENIEKSSIRSNIEGLFTEWDIKETLTNEHYRKVSIGLAADASYVRLALLLERDYVQYDQLPVIENGILTLSGRVKNGINLDGGKGLSAAVIYDPPPQPITTGQIARVYSSNNGILVAAIRRPPAEGKHWTEDESTRKYNPCPSPYDIAANAPAPGSSGGSFDLHDAAKKKCLAIRADAEGGIEITYPRITASKWAIQGDTFAITADLSDVIQRHGNGLYKVVVWGSLEGEQVGISEYVIFHGVTPPDTYYPN